MCSPPTRANSDNVSNTARNQPGTNTLTESRLTAVISACLPTSRLPILSIRPVHCKKTTFDQNQCTVTSKYITIYNAPNAFAPKIVAARRIDDAEDACLTGRRMFAMCSKQLQSARKTNLSTSTLDLGEKSSLDKHEGLHRQAGICRTSVG